MKIGKPTLNKKQNTSPKNGSMGWSVVRTDWAVHVVPQDDVKPHTLDLHCHCNPREEVAAKGHLVVIHDAFDGRLVVEQAEDLIKQLSSPPIYAVILRRSHWFEKSSTRKLRSGFFVFNNGNMCGLK